MKRLLPFIAMAAIGAVDALHTEYSQGAVAQAGKVPVVKMVGSTAVESQGKDDQGRVQKSTNYAPDLVIIGWTPKPIGWPPVRAPPPADCPRGSCLTPTAEVLAWCGRGGLLKILPQVSTAPSDWWPASSAAH